MIDLLGTFFLSNLVNKHFLSNLPGPALKTVGAQERSKSWVCTFASTTAARLQNSQKSTRRIQSLSHPHHPSSLPLRRTSSFLELLYAAYSKSSNMVPFASRRSPKTTTRLQKAARKHHEDYEACPCDNNLLWLRKRQDVGQRNTHSFPRHRIQSCYSRSLYTRQDVFLGNYEECF